MVDMLKALHKVMHPGEYRGSHDERLSRPRAELEAEIRDNTPHNFSDPQLMQGVTDAYHQRGTLEVDPGMAQRPWSDRHTPGGPGEQVNMERGGIPFEGPATTGRPRTQAFDEGNMSPEVAASREGLRQSAAPKVGPNGRYGPKGKYNFPPGLSQEEAKQHRVQETHADKWRDQTKIEKKYRERKGSKKAFKIL